MTYTEWYKKISRMYDIAERIQKSRLERMYAECRLAGLGEFNGCTTHNAMIGYEEGRPWAEVDYSHLRKCLWIESHLFDASAIVSRWDRRVRQEVR